MFLIQLDITVVNLALPRIGAGLHAPVSALQWVIDGYTLPVACLLLTGGRLGDRFGHRRVFLVGLAVFAVTSGLCATAPTAAWLVAFRVAQGAGAALQLPATLALLVRTFPDRATRTRAIGIWAGVAGLSLAIGPLVGGGLVDTFGWQSVFLLNLPVAALAIALCLRGVAPDTVPPSRRVPVDIPGQITACAALAALTFGIIEGPERGWSAPLVITALAGAALLLAVFVTVERSSSHPLLPMRVARNGVIGSASLAATVMAFVIIGLLFGYSLFFQQAQHLSAAAAGYRFLPLSVAFILTGPATGRLTGARHPRLIVVAGLTLLGGTTAALTMTDSTTGYPVIALLFTGIGIGYGIVSAASAAAATSALDAGQAGLASSLNTTGRMLGGVLGVAFTGDLLVVKGTAIDAAALPHVTAGYALACLIGALVTLICGRPPTSRDPVSRSVSSTAARHQGEHQSTGASQQTG
jgi:DHA2 family methylenomycin A resistance protein-like MFS transporter